MSGQPDIDGVLPRHSALLKVESDADPADKRTVREAIVQMLEEDRRAAYESRQPSVAVSASVAIAKVLSFFEQAEQAKEAKRFEVRFSTPDQERALARKLAFMLAKADITLEQADEAARKALERVNEGATIIHLDASDRGIC